MPSEQPLNLLQEGARALGLELPAGAPEQFLLYLTELKRWNARVNLTALNTDREIVSKHFLDSLAILPFLGEPASLADLGAGAGFPGLALKLALPDLALTLVEPREKKAAFLEYLAARLKLDRVEVSRVHLTPALARQWGPRFQAVVSRAAFQLARFLELAAPMLRPGGLVLALKGPHLIGGELEAATTVCQLVGLTPLQLQEYRLPVDREPRLAATAHRPR
jgi:16S rRNA (guanine527-N7)-methyltransferase